MSEANRIDREKTTGDAVPLGKAFHNPQGNRHMEIKDVVERVKGASDLLKEIYKDLAQPGVREVGQAIGTLLGCLNVLLIPLKRLSEERWILFEAHMEKFRRKVQAIPPGKVCEVCPEIGIPALERLTYIRNEDLSELFLNLLATAANQDSVNLAHPSFVRIIDHLSPDEARLLVQFRQRKRFLGVSLRVKGASSSEVAEVGSVYGELANTPGLIFPQNMDVYVPNLQGLGLLSFERDVRWLDEIEHEEWSKKYRELEVQARQLGGNDEYEIDDEEATTELTGFGRMFIEACTTRKEPP